MRFLKIRGWNKIKFVEDDIFVPILQEDGLEEPDYSADLRSGGTPSPRFFSQLVVPINFEHIHNLKYVELTLEYNVDPPSTKKYYGWVDSIVMKDSISTIINWHIDYWRTYWYVIRDSAYIKGWITRRRAKGDFWDPPQDIPTDYYIPSGDVELLGKQVNGVNWIIITFAANLGELGALLSSVNKVPLIGGLATSLFKMVADVPGYILGDVDSLENAKENIPYFPTAAPDIYCLTFPILMHYKRNAYIKLTGTRIGALRGARKEVFICPSLQEIISGDLMKALGIKGDKVLSCVISPICPLNVIGGDGTKTDAIELKTPTSLEYGYEGRTQVPRISFTRHGGRGVLRVNVDKNIHLTREYQTFGIYDAGLIIEGCPNLPELLDRFCFDPQFNVIVRDVDVNEYNEITSEIHINADNTQNLRKYMRFDYYVQMVMRRHDGIIRPTVNAVTLPLRRFQNPPHTVWYRFGNDRQEGDLFIDGYVFKPHPNFVRYNFEAHQLHPHYAQIIGNHCILYRRTGQFQYNEEWNELEETVEKEVYDVREIYVKLEESEDFYGSAMIMKGPDLINVLRDDLLGIHATRFCINALQPRYFINAGSLLWPIHYVQLRRPMQTDASRVLVLIGSHGEILHQFRQNQIIDFYTYEVVISQTQVYIRFRFSSYFALAGDAEVCVPLQSIPLPSNQMNEYLANGGRMMDIMTSKADADSKEEANKTSFKYNIIGGLVGAAMSGGGLFGIAAKAGTSLINSKLQYEQTKAMNAVSNAMSDRMQQLKDAKEMMGGGMVAVQGTLADAHDPVPLCLTYLMRDTASVDNYYKSTQITGVAVNERIDDLEDFWKEGPIQMRDPTIICDDAPAEAIEVIKGYLKRGVCACHDPELFQ